jgi:hypothetical protein
MGTLIRAVAQNRSAMPILTRLRDSDANQELIHYDDIRVGGIPMRQGPMESESSLLFGVASRLPAGSPSLRCGSRRLRCAAAVATPQVNGCRFHRLHRAFDAWKRAMWGAGLKLPLGRGRTQRDRRREPGRELPVFLKRQQSASVLRQWSGRSEARAHGPEVARAQLVAERAASELGSGFRRLPR